MKDIIFIAGAPGSDKSTIAKILRSRLGSPLFEFGWIPEFRNTGEGKISYSEEASLAFENLTLVTKNYVKHGFKNIIITDLDNEFIQQIPELFKDYDFMIYTLRLDEEMILKERVLDETRSSEYRDWEKALEINRLLKDRQPFVNEVFINVTSQSAEEIANQIATESGSRPDS